MKTPTLETERLILRPISLDDVPAVQKYFNNWNIVQHITAPWPYPAEGAEGHLKETVSAMDAGDQMSWAITLKPDCNFIGRIDYCGLLGDKPDRGFWIAEPFHGKGYMTEAVSITQDFIFLDYGLKKFEVGNFKGNEASRRVKEKTGARFTHEKTDIVRDEEIIVEMWEVTKESWLEAKEKLKE